MLYFETLAICILYHLLWFLFTHSFWFNAFSLMPSLLLTVVGIINFEECRYQSIPTYYINMRDKHPRNQMQAVGHAMVLFEEQILKKHASIIKDPKVNGENMGPSKREWSFLFSQWEERGDIARRERLRLATKRGGLVLRNPMILFEGTGGRD